MLLCCCPFHLQSCMMTSIPTNSSRWQCQSQSCSPTRTWMRRCQITKCDTPVNITIAYDVMLERVQWVAVRSCLYYKTRIVFYSCSRFSLQQAAGAWFKIDFPSNVGHVEVNTDYWPPNFDFFLFLTKIWNQFGRSVRRSTFELENLPRKKTSPRPRSAPDSRRVPNKYVVI